MSVDKKTYQSLPIDQIAKYCRTALFGQLIMALSFFASTITVFLAWNTVPHQDLALCFILCQLVGAATSHCIQAYAIMRIRVWVRNNQSRQETNDALATESAHAQ